MKRLVRFSLLQTRATRRSRPRTACVATGAALTVGLLAATLSACSLVVDKRIEEPENKDAAVSEDASQDADAALPAPELVTWRNEPGESEPDFIRSAELFSIKATGFDGLVDVVVETQSKDASRLVSGITPDDEGWVTFQVPTVIPAGPVTVTVRDSALPDRAVSLPRPGRTLTLLRWILGLSGKDLLFWTMDQPGHLKSTSARKIQQACGSSWTQSDPTWVRVGDWFSVRQEGRWGFVGCPTNNDIWIGTDQTRALYLPLLGTSAPVLSSQWPGQGDTIEGISFEYSAMFGPQARSGLSILHTSDPPNRLAGWNLTYENSGPSWNQSQVPLFGPNAQGNFVPGGDESLVSGVWTPTNKILVQTRDDQHAGHVWFGEVSQEGVSLLGEVANIAPAGHFLVSAFWRQVPGRDNLLLGVFWIADNAQTDATTLVALMDADNNGEIRSRITLQDDGLIFAPIDLVFAPGQPNLAALLTARFESQDPPRVVLLNVDGTGVTAAANPLTSISPDFYVTRAVWGQDGDQPYLVVWAWWPTGSVQNPNNPPVNSFFCRPNPQWTCMTLTGGQVLWADVDPSDPGAFYVSTDEGLGKRKLRYCRAEQAPTNLSNDCNELLTFPAHKIQAIAVQP